MLERPWWMASGWVPRTYSGNPQEWSAFKFVFKAYVGVIASPVLTMDLAEQMTAPLAEEDGHVTRSLSFLLAQVLSKAALQLMMNVGEQNGL